MIDLAFLSFEVFDLKAQAFQKARVQIGIKEFAQRFHAAEIPTRFTLSSITCLIESLIVT